MTPFGVVIALALLAVLALGSGIGEAAQDEQGKRDGIDRAKKVGIVVEPGAEALMEQAPIGSCFNDPTQPKCPKVEGVAAAKTMAMPNGGVGFAFADSAAPPPSPSPPAEPSPPAAPGSAPKAPATADAPASSKPRPRAHAAYFPQCWVRAQPPVHSGGWMWGPGQAYCTNLVYEFELYVSLRRTEPHGSGNWRILDTRWAHKYGGGSLSRQAGYDCGHTATRHYRTLAQSYAVYNGNWYGGQHQDDTYRNCP